MPFAITAQTPVFKDHGVAMALTQWMVWGCDKAYRLGRLALLQEIWLPCYKGRSGTLFSTAQQCFRFGVLLHYPLAILFKGLFEIAIPTFCRLGNWGEVVAGLISHSFRLFYKNWKLEGIPHPLFIPLPKAWLNKWEMLKRFHKMPSPTANNLIMFSPILCMFTQM